MLAAYYENIGPRTQLACMKCGHDFAREERVRPVFIVGGIEKHPKGNERAVVLAAAQDYTIHNELVHVDCGDKKIVNVSRIVPASRKVYAVITRPDQFREIEPRGSGYQCVRCLKDFQREDRVFSMHIVLGVGYNEQAGGNVAACSGNYEVAHADCNDPKLNGSGSILIF